MTKELVRLATLDSSILSVQTETWVVVVSLGKPTSSHPLTQLLLEKIHVEQLVNTLKVVHDEGIIHRDVRVSNIFWLSDQEVLLNDWGASVLNNEATLYAGAPSPHIHPEIPRSDMYLPSARHDLYSLVSSLSLLLMPGVGDKSRRKFIDGAFQAANACDYELLTEKLKELMR